MTDYDYEEDEVTYACPECGGMAMILGVLGNLMWMRCQDCGLEFYHDQLED